MTYRERREARAERLRAWADKRVADANSTLSADRARYGGDIAFATQPGHIPERARMIRRTDRAFESLNKAERMSSRADSIERAAAHAIYSDDEDAIEKLQAKIEKLEAKRARIVAYNVTARKAAKTGDTTGDLSILNERERTELLGYLRFSYMRKPGAPFPSYTLSNLSGLISTSRARLARLEREAK